MGKVIVLLGVLFSLVCVTVAQTDILTLRRADGSTYELEGEVEHYKDNNFVILLGAGGKTILSLEQVQTIVFPEVSSKAIAFEDKLILQTADGTTYTSNGKVKAYENNKFTIVLGSGEKINFPTNQVQAIQFQKRFPRLKKKKLGDNSLKVVISLKKHKIHEDESGYENCSGYQIWASKIPLNIELLKLNARRKARKRDTGKKFKKLMEKEFYEWYFYEDLVENFKKFPYYSTTDVKGIGLIRDLAPGIYYVGACGISSGRTYRAHHNVYFAWYCQVKVQGSKTAIINLNFSNREVTAIDKNWGSYGGK